MTLVSPQGHRRDRCWGGKVCGQQVGGKSVEGGQCPKGRGHKPGGERVEARPRSQERTPWVGQPGKKEGTLLEPKTL